MPPPVPRLVPATGTPRRTRADRVGERTADLAPPPGGPDSVGADALRPVDDDVHSAVGRVLEEILADRLTRARTMDALFTQELAARVAQFTRDGGKRIRSQLVWWSMRACGGDGDAHAAAALRIGAAIELLQSCALIHDDVMDGSALRRGRPALHTVIRDGYSGTAAPERVGRFGDAAAVLAGDLALAWADDTVAETVLPPWTTTVVRRMWSDMRTEMVAGQYLDMQGQLAHVRSQPRALRVACLKSALYSVERPLALGAAVAGADTATVSALCAAGRRVGMAFQLRDDLNDVFGDARHNGKPLGGDIREGKPTYLVALALERAEQNRDQGALTTLRRALGDPQLSDQDLDEARDALVRTGARNLVEQKIERLAAQGFRQFDSIRLVPEPAARLRHLLSTAAGRSAPDIPEIPSEARRSNPAGGRR
ncbi:polyprenyl synthetase family protein [Streptomyces sp. NPDC048002]|uniref:polyprenyl synthetase family protein n=1 Tax=Streptomyces sp. NPDC048002 TaxID=3154344 RepID=UPI0033F32F1D